MMVSFNLLLVGWTIIVGVIAFWAYQTTYSETLILVRREAYQGYEKDVMFRSWVAEHGGVYVPVTGKTQPNPYLSKIKERDIITPSNRKLTLMNPAYVTREVHELSFKKSGIKGHITSLNPIRKENSADEWETKALHSFEKGSKEYFGFDYIQNEKFFRFMAPLVTDAECLKCHKAQGYKVGEIRGGISSSVPWKLYEASITKQTETILMRYGIIWLLGFVGISVVKRRFLIYITKRDEYEDAMKRLNEDLQISKKVIEENLSEKNILVEKLTETKEKLEKINSEKDKFFSIIAHDLRSPFQGFIGMTEIMADNEHGFSREELLTISSEMNRSAINLYKLLTNLLEWAKVQKGSVAWEPKEINLADFINSNINLIDKLGKQKEIKLFSEVPDNQKVFADEAMLNSVLRNLLSNAIKFTQNEGTVLVKSKEIGNKMIEISISDSGIGMPESLVAKLFKLEEKVGRLGTEGELSTGLGLLLCKEFVEKHGGKIWVESQEGVGSTFYFSVPEK
jgi:signal transduction histidine kinase